MKKLNRIFFFSVFIIVAAGSLFLGCESKKNNNAIIGLLLSSSSTSSSTSSGSSGSSGVEDTVNWNKQYDGGSSSMVNSIAIDSSGNVYVAGFGTDIVNPSSGTDWWIKKYSAGGVENMSWDIKYSGGSSASANSVAVDSGGNVYVVGYGTDIATGSSGSDWVIKKYASDGTEDTANWNKYFDGGSKAAAMAVAVDSSGTVYVAGYGFNIAGASSGGDWWIKKFASNGTEITAGWNKIIDGGSDAAAYSVAIDSGGFVYVAGYGTNLVSGSSGADWLIKKYASNGTEITSGWDKKVSGGSDDFANSIAIDSGGYVYVAGSGMNLCGPSTSADILIKKYESDGDQVFTGWDKMFDSGGIDAVKSIAVDSSANVYIAGYGQNLAGVSSGYDWWIKKFSSIGDEDTANWNKKFDDGVNGRDETRSVAIDSSGNVYVTGYGQNLVNGSSSYDWWIKKFNGN